MRLLVPLVLVLAVAGCLGGGDGGAPETPAAAADTPASGAGDALGNTTLSTDPDAETVSPVAVPVSYSGRSPLGVCVFAAGQCVVPQPGAEDYHLIEAPPGRPTHLSLQVTYSGQLPGMAFYVGVCVGADEGAECTDYQTGPSPLVAEFDLSAFPPGGVYGISVGSISEPAMNAGAAVFGPADFEVVGVLTLVPGA